MKTCDTCKFRDAEFETCECPKIQEDWGQRKESDATDMMLYSYSEGGSFWVGPKFGCIHHEPKT